MDQPPWAAPVKSVRVPAAARSTPGKTAKATRSANERAASAADQPAAPPERRRATRNQFFRV
ncbi:MAG: hypothetical protein AMXMBFR47_45660 [Planctomycetota bacterium]